MFSTLKVPPRVSTWWNPEHRKQARYSGKKWPPPWFIDPILKQNSGVDLSGIATIWAPRLTNLLVHLLGSRNLASQSTNNISSSAIHPSTRFPLCFIPHLSSTDITIQSPTPKTAVSKKNSNINSKLIPLDVHLWFWAASKGSFNSAFTTSFHRFTSKKIWTGKRDSLINPLDPNVNLDDDKPIEAPSIGEQDLQIPHSLTYATLIGSLMYLALGTRPDIATLSTILAQFTNALPRVIHQDLTYKIGVLSDQVSE